MQTKRKPGSLAPGLLLDIDIRDESFREQEDIPHLLRIQRIAQGNETDVLHIELLPAIPDGREVRDRHTEVFCKIFVQITMSNHGGFQFFFVKHFHSFLSKRITVERFD